MKRTRLLTIAGALLAMLALALLAGACGDKYEFVLDKTSVPAGEVTFALTNEGDLEHELLVYPAQDIGPLLEEKVAAVKAGGALSISSRIEGLVTDAAGEHELEVEPGKSGTLQVTPAR